MVRQAHHEVVRQAHHEVGRRAHHGVVLIPRLSRDEVDPRPLRYSARGKRKVQPRRSNSKISSHAKHGGTLVPALDATGNRDRKPKMALTPELVSLCSRAESDAGP